MRGFSWGLAIGNLFLSIFWISLFLTNLIYLKSLQPTYVQNNNIIGSCDDLLKEKIESVARNVSDSHTYIIGQYDCSQFSQELVNQLALQNISAYCLTGQVWDGESWGGHTWVEVNFSGKIIPVEATGGYIIADKFYEGFYISSKKGYCI